MKSFSLFNSWKVALAFFAIASATRVSYLGRVDTANNRPEAHLLAPFWSAPTIYGESLLFVQEAGQRPKSTLLFTPLKNVALQSASGEVTYREGQDYVLDAATRTLSLPVGSKIPLLTAAQLRPAAGAPQSYVGHIDGKSSLFWSEGHVFHDMQVEATYAHKRGEWKSAPPRFAATGLSNTVGKLRRKDPFKIVVLGDSISAGFNASGFTDAPPYMPPYPELVRRNLHEHYGAPVEIVNLSVAGRTSKWGLTQMDALFEAKPDLVLIAFGMNDAGSLTSQNYIANIKQQVALIHQERPHTEIILVATMLPNPVWSVPHQERFAQFRDGLAKMCGQGVALADMTTVWAELIRHKNYVSISGSGINHPNDFGHRLYAQVILGLLVDEAKNQRSKEKQ